MGQISLSIPQSGSPNLTEDPKVASDLTTIQTVINGNLDAGNLATGIVLQLASTGTARAAAFGQATFTGTGVAATATLTKAHGLGRTPAAVLFTPLGWQGFVVESAGPDATNLSYQAVSTSGVFTNAVVYNFYWLAIG